MMQVIDDGRCFVCGRDNPIGLKAGFTVDPQRKRAETRVRISELYQGWQGVIHGGIISALLDEICAQVCLGCGFQVVTSEMKVRFRAPLPAGSLVTVTGEITGERRRLVDVRGRLEFGGKLIAEADAVMYRTAYDLPV